MVRYVFLEQSTFLRGEAGDKELIALRPLDTARRLFNSDHALVHPPGRPIRPPWVRLPPYRVLSGGGPVLPRCSTEFAMSAEQQGGGHAPPGDKSGAYAAIDKNARPGNIVGARPGEEGDGFGDFPGLAVTGNRQVREDRRRERAVCGVHVGVDWAGADQIDGNVDRKSVV